MRAQIIRKRVNVLLNAPDQSVHASKYIMRDELQQTLDAVDVE